MLSNENQLLALCTLPNLSEHIQEINQILSQPLNWQVIHTAASWYAIKPLLNKCLKDHSGKQAIPTDIAIDLKDSYNSILIRNMYIYGLLAKILPIFDQHNIPCIVLKGAALAEPLYGDIGLRPMQDIDLMFNKEDVSRVMPLLADIGFHHEGSKVEEHYLDNHYHITYTHSDTDIPIELHWHIEHDRLPDRLRLKGGSLIQGWFDRAQRITLSGVKAQVLCSEDLIIHLSLHFLKHRFATHGGGFVSSTALLQLADISRLIEQYYEKINWIRLNNEASYHGIKNLVFATIKLASDISGNRLGEDAMGLAESAEMDKQIISLMHKRIFLREDMNSALPHGVFRLSSWASIHGILRQIVKLLLPSRERLQLRYSLPVPSKKVYVYYLLNPYNYYAIFLRLKCKIPQLKEEKLLQKWIGGI